MTDAYAGDDDRFLTGYQIWKIYDREGKKIDVWDPEEGTIVTRDEDGTVVHWVRVEEPALPDGVDLVNDRVLVDER